MNLQDRYIQALVAYGYLRSGTYSRKYVKMHKPGATGIFWVDRAGAVRFGPTVTGSIAMSEAWKARLVEGTLVAHGTRRIPPR